MIEETDGGSTSIRAEGMIEEGKVIEIKGDITKVEIRRSTSCGTCRACWMAEGGKMIAEAENLIGAKVGQRVRLQVSGSILKAAFVVYILPLLGLIIGYGVGSFISRAIGYPGFSEKVGLISGLALLVLSFIAVRYYGKKAGQRYQIKITQIVA